MEVERAWGMGVAPSQSLQTPTVLTNVYWINISQCSVFQFCRSIFNVLKRLFLTILSVLLFLFCHEGLTGSSFNHSRSSTLLNFYCCCLKTYLLQSTCIAMVWKFVFPGNLYVGTQMPNVRVLGSETFGWWVGNGINVFIKVTPARTP